MSVEHGCSQAAMTSGMHIRRAETRDIAQLHKLLREVLEVHHAGRPDLFKTGAAKYTNDELCNILADEHTPVFGAFADDDVTLLGYTFCIFQQHEHSNILTNIKTLYIDDLCVDESARGQHIGTALYQYVLDVARACGCYNVTLNVWSCNPGAQAFYERLGLTPYKVGMEQIL